MDKKRIKTLKETDKKCASCGGVLSFDPDKGVLVCPFCDSEFAFETEDAEIATEIDFDTAEHTANRSWGETTYSVLCKSCGAESVFDGRQIADVCPYCGSNLVVTAGGGDSLSPNGICPFEISRTEADEVFKDWIKHRLFAPKAAKRAASPEAFKGVYLPCWTFDADTVSHYTGQYGIDETETDSEGNEHTDTDWYNTSGTYSRSFNDLPVSGTDRYEEKLMRRIRPYDTDNSVTYKPEYLSGFCAEKYTVGLADAWNQAKRIIHSRLDSDITDEIRSDHHADHVRGVSFTTHYDNVGFKYLLLPVWMSSFTYKDKIYRFMINGQTGKVGGHAPVSVLRVLALIGAILGLIALLVLLGYRSQ